MAVFTYKATTSEKKLVAGTMTAPTKQEVATMLAKQDLSPVIIAPLHSRTQVMNRLPDIERIAFCRYVGTILNAGLPLTEGIPVLKDETKNPLMRQILDDIMYHLEHGQSVSTALMNYPKAFNPFFVTLIKAGEVSGTLSESFRYLEQQLRAEYSLSQKIKSALMYPSIVFVAMFGIGFLMFFFILPQIGKVFLSMKIPLHVFTKTLFSISVAAGAIRYQLIAVSIVVVIAVAIFFRQPIGKKLILKLISPVPVVNNLMQKVDLARFSRIFSTLVASAVPITDALNIALSSMSHPRFKSIADTIIKDVLGGKSVSATFSQRKTFPGLLTQMISAGEKSGTLDTSLNDLAGFYEEEVEESVKKAVQLLEPLLMLLVGIGVGGIILAIIVPLYSVVGNLQEASGAR